VEETRLARPAPDIAVGVDLGVIVPVMTSDGDTLGVARPTTHLVLQAKDAQRRMSRCTRGSKGWRRHLKRMARCRRLRALQVHAQLHKASHRLAQCARTVVIEDLSVKNMTASARGTAGQPGRSVSAKAGLNRAILEVPKFGFRMMLAAKLARAGGTLIVVDPRGTSQTCSRCGHRDRRSRTAQATFECIACGLRIHADVNAARNILARGVRGDAASPPTVGQGFLFGDERRKTEKPHAAPMSAGHRTASQDVKAPENRTGSSRRRQPYSRFG
jgi:putative transposase